MKTRNSIEVEHKCHSFILLRGMVNRIDQNKNKIRFTHNLPSKPDAFVGRNQDVRQVLKILKEGNRLVTITGEPGIGKTAVAKAVIHYLKDRDEELIRNGVSFLNIVNCPSLPQLIHTFVSTVEEGTGNQIINKAEKKDTMQMFKEMLKFLSKLDMLIVIDNAEDLL